MPTSRRRKSLSVTQNILASPTSFEFSQLVRLLERASVLDDTSEVHFAKKPVARFTPPSTEAVHFHSNSSLSFPSAEVSDVSIKTKKSKSQQWSVDVNFMGLTGCQGVLPYHYTEILLQRLKIKDKSLKYFFDCFNHRTISLFYQASNKYRLPIEYERKKLTQTKHNEAQDNHTQALFSLMGLGSPHLKDRLHIKDESLIQYSGLFSQQIKTASGLKQILQQHFNIPVEIKEFVGQWDELIDDVRSKLPSSDTPSGQNNRLGKSVMLGSKGWFVQGKFNIILGPLDAAQLQTFSPGTKALKALNEIARLYAGMEYDSDIKIQIKKSDIPEKIHLTAKTPPTVGWNTWLSSRKNQHENDDQTMEISVSAGRLS